MDAFDSDVIIYAADELDPRGHAVRQLFDVARGPVGVGSVLLLPEVLSKPDRQGNAEAVEALSRLLARLDLHVTDRATATMAAGLGAEYGLRAADAVHLATAVQAGATRFITNNRRDFDDQRIEEIEIVHPEGL